MFPLRTLKLAPIIAFLFFAAITLLLWQDQNRHDRELLERLAETTAEQLRVRVEGLMGSRVAALEAVADRWVERQPSDFSQERFLSFARIIHSRYPGFTEINWIDPQGFFGWVYPEESDAHARGKRASEHPDPQVHALFESGGRDQKSFYTPSFDFGEGRYCFDIFLPLIHEGKLQGYLNGRFGVDQILSLALSPEISKNFAVSLYEGDHLIYSSESVKGQDRDVHTIEVLRGIDFGEKSWKISVVAKDIDKYSSAFKNFSFLIFGLGLSAVLALLIYLLLQRLEMYRESNELALREVEKRELIEEALRRSHEELERIVEERTAQLSQSNQNLKDEIGWRKLTEEALRKRSLDLDRRVRELSCVYAFSNLLEKPGASLPEIMEEVVRILPTGWREPGNICVRLVVDGQTFQNPDFEETDLKLSGAVRINGKSIGAVEVFYRKHADEDALDLLMEERDLLNEFCARLGRLIARKHAQEALKLANQTLLDIIEFLPDATFVIDRERMVIAWNRAIEEMTGVSKEQMLGKSEHAYAIPFYGEARPILIDAIFDDNNECHSRYDMVRKEGNTLFAEVFVPMVHAGKGAYLWVKASPLFDRHGRIIGGIESIRDITEWKRMEKELQDNAEKIKLFAYSVSHDLKSPIIGINGLTRLLHRQYGSALDERGKRYCDQILKASEQALALVEEINLYIKTKEMPLSFEQIDPREIIQMVRDEFDALLSMRRVRWHQPEFIPELKADRLSVLRVFRNFVDNALKYGGAELSEIRIEYETSGDFHVFSVIDDGIGIKPEHAEKIFELFQRSGSVKEVEGTGLGLAIIKEIAEKHHGKVWIDTDCEKGTTFRIAISRHL